MLDILQQMESKANSLGIRECDLSGIPSVEPGTTMSGHANFSTRTIDAVSSKGECFEVSWQNGYKSTFRGFNVDFFTPYAGGGFEWKLQNAVSQAKANAAKYGSTSFDMCAPFDTLPRTLTGHYDASTSTFIGIDNDGRLFKCVSGSNLQFAGFGSDYFKKNPNFRQVDPCNKPCK